MKYLSIMLGFLFFANSAVAEFSSKEEFFKSLSDHGFEYVLEVSKSQFFKHKQGHEIKKSKMIMTKTGEKVQFFEKRLPELDIKFPVGYLRSKFKDTDRAFAYNIADIMLCYKVKFFVSDQTHPMATYYLIPHSIDYVAETIRKNQK